MNSGRRGGGNYGQGGGHHMGNQMFHNRPSSNGWDNNSQQPNAAFQQAQDDPRLSDPRLSAEPEWRRAQIINHEKKQAEETARSRRPVDHNQAEASRGVSSFNAQAPVFQ